MGSLGQSAETISPSFDIALRWATNTVAEAKSFTNHYTYVLLICKSLHLCIFNLQIIYNSLHFKFANRLQAHNVLEQIILGSNCPSPKSGHLGRSLLSFTVRPQVQVVTKWSSSSSCNDFENIIFIGINAQNIYIDKNAHVALVHGRT